MSNKRKETWTACAAMLALGVLPACVVEQPEEKCRAKQIAMSVPFIEEGCIDCGPGFLTWNVYQDLYDDPTSPPPDILASFAIQADLLVEGTYFEWNAHPCGNFHSHVEYDVEGEEPLFSEVMSYTVESEEVTTHTTKLIE